MGHIRGITFGIMGLIRGMGLISRIACAVIGLIIRGRLLHHTTMALQKILVADGTT
jgi:hypothetical protein